MSPLLFVFLLSVVGSFNRRYFVQINDVHIDQHYVVGSEADCSKPTCCRGPKDPNAKRPAGKFGDYKCNTPILVYNETIKYLHEEYGDQIDFVSFLGDSVSMDIWLMSETEAYEDDKIVADQLNKHFPKRYIPVIGNHDICPNDQMASGYEGFKWFYKGMYDIYKMEIPSEEIDWFLMGGYYGRDINDKIRVLVFNNMFGDPLNILKELDTDQGGQIAWLKSELEKARESGKVVWLFTHIPMGPNTKYTFPKMIVDEYYEKLWTLWDEYSDIIIALFAGHTHDDEFRLVTSKKDASTVIGLELIGASLTMSSTRDPRFRLFEYDADTGEILDYTVFHFDVTQANRDGYITWKKLYRFREYFSCDPDVPLLECHKRINSKLQTDDSFFDYYGYVYNNIKKPCSIHATDKEECMKIFRCAIVLGTPEQYEKCVLAK